MQRSRKQWVSACSTTSVLHQRSVRTNSALSAGRSSFWTGGCNLLRCPWHLADLYHCRDVHHGKRFSCDFLRVPSYGMQATASKKHSTTTRISCIFRSMFIWTESSIRQETPETCTIAAWALVLASKCAKILPKV